MTDALQYKSGPSLFAGELKGYISTPHSSFYQLYRRFKMAPHCCFVKLIIQATVEKTAPLKNSCGIVVMSTILNSNSYLTLQNGIMFNMNVVSSVRIVLWLTCCGSNIEYFEKHLFIDRYHSSPTAPRVYINRLTNHWHLNWVKCWNVLRRIKW